jgi:hypothetical protein
MLCIIRDGDEHKWERSNKDLQIYHVFQDWKKLKDSAF